MDNYEKEVQLRNAGYDQEFLDKQGSDSISFLFMQEIGEDDIITAVKEKGENEGDCGYRIWLSNLNGKCNINGHTDIMSAVVTKNTKGNDSLSIQVNTPDDRSTIFVDIYDFNADVADLIYDQIVN